MAGDVPPNKPEYAMTGQDQGNPFRTGNAPTCTNHWTAHVGALASGPLGWWAILGSNQ